MTPEQHAALLATIQRLEERLDAATKGVVPASKPGEPGVVLATARALKGLLSSKKFLVTLAAGMVLVAKRLGFDLSQGSAELVVILSTGLVVGYGLEDQGKKAAETKAATDIVTQAPKA